jgi:hypothetical protein
MRVRNVRYIFLRTLKVTYHRHVHNCGLLSNTSCRTSGCVYDLLPYQSSHAMLEWLSWHAIIPKVGCRIQAQPKRKNFNKIIIYVYKCLLTYAIISGPCIKCLYSCCHLKVSCVLHFVITDLKKLKHTRLGSL